MQLGVRIVDRVRVALFTTPITTLANKHDGVTQIARAGLVAIVPGNVRHSVRALTDGRAIIVDYPLRKDFG
jgi:hypothetical protein